MASVDEMIGRDFVESVFDESDPFEPPSNVETSFASNKASDIQTTSKTDNSSVENAESAEVGMKRVRKNEDADPKIAGRRTVYYQNRKNKEAAVKRQREDEAIRKELLGMDVIDRVELINQDRRFIDDSMKLLQSNMSSLIDNARLHDDRQRIMIESLCSELVQTRTSKDKIIEELNHKLTEVTKSQRELIDKHSHTTREQTAKFTTLNVLATTFERENEVLKEQVSRADAENDRLTLELRRHQCDADTLSKMELCELSKLQSQLNERMVLINKVFIQKNRERTTCPVCLMNMEESTNAFTLCSISGCGHKICKDCFHNLKSPKMCTICRKSIEESMLAPVRD